MQKPLKIGVIGDVMLDVYLQGTSHRLSPEAPVPVVSEYTVDYRPGGAANVALNIIALGADPVLIGAIGSDDAAANLKAAMAKASISDDHLQATLPYTTTKSRVIVNGKHVVRLDKEWKQVNSSPLVDIEAALQSIGAIDGLILQDYNKGVLSPTVITSIMEWSKQRLIPVFVDPKFDNFGLYQGATLIKPNKKEAEHILQCNIETSNAVIKVRDLLQQLNTDYAVITLGGDGLVIANQEDAQYFEAIPLESPDVCGAGDALIAVAAFGILQGFSLDRLGRHMVQAGWSVCKQIGVAPLVVEDLQTY